MSELASPGQLRAVFLRWALFLVPGIMLLGFLSGRVAGSGADNPWFASLTKPALYPPPITFPVVWSILYVLMGLALAMVCAARSAPGRNRAIVLFCVQLAINLAWTPLFFGAHQLSGALLLIVVLDAALLLTVLAFRTVRPLAAALLLPYLAWVLFASLLTFQLWQANPDADGKQISGAVSSVELK